MFKGQAIELKWREIQAKLLSLGVLLHNSKMASSTNRAIGW